jgi:hypothetical protein
MPWRRRTSRDQPIVKAQRGYVPVIRRVVGDQSEVVDQSHRRDHKVGGRNLDSLLEQRTVHLAELFRTCRVKIDNGNVLKQVGDEGE